MQVGDTYSCIWFMQVPPASDIKSRRSRKDSQDAGRGTLRMWRWRCCRFTEPQWPPRGGVGRGGAVRCRAVVLLQPRNITQQCKGLELRASEQKAQAKEPQAARPAAPSAEQFKRSYARQTLPMHSLWSPLAGPPPPAPRSRNLISMHFAELN